MLIHESSDLITTVHYDLAIHGTAIEVAELKGGKAFVLSHNAMAIYKTKACIADSLGQGLIATIDIPENGHLPITGTWIQDYKAGYIGLSDNKVILITPKSFRLYHSKKDALHNQHLICELVHNDE